MSERDFVFPEADPINLAGEADAYPGESWDNAAKRLFYVACQCGYIAQREARTDGGRVYVRAHGREFRLDFDQYTDRLCEVSFRDEDDRVRPNPWRRRWSTPDFPTMSADEIASYAGPIYRASVTANGFDGKPTHHDLESTSIQNLGRILASFNAGKIVQFGPPTIPIREGGAA